MNWGLWFLFQENFESRVNERIWCSDCSTFTPGNGRCDSFVPSDCLMLKEKLAQLREGLLDGPHLD